jgi:hypothetical protein
MAKTNSIHQESIDFITRNINAKTSEIPKHLLEYWYVLEHIENSVENLASKAPYLIFLHAHKGSPRKVVELSINIFESK